MSYNLTPPLLALALTTSAWGQVMPANTNRPKETKPASAKAPESNPAANSESAKPDPVVANLGVEFSDTYLKIDSVGLLMRLPVGVRSELGTGADISAATIASEDRTWMVQIESPRTSRVGVNLKEAADALIEQLIAASPAIVDSKDKQVVGFRGKLIERQDNLILPGGNAVRFYIESQVTDVEDAIAKKVTDEAMHEPETGKQYSEGSVIVRGFTLFQPSPERFVIIDFRTPGKAFAKTRIPYEAMVSTAQFADVATLSTGRKTAIETTMALLRRTTPEDIKQLVERPERWQRLYIPGKTGAKADDIEVGYRRVRSSIGKRGQLDPTRDAKSYTKIEQEEGLIFQMDARALDFDRFGLDAKVKQIIDSQSVYFMTPDRQSEAWSNRTAVKGSKSTSQLTELGARNGTDMTVSVTGTADSASMRPMIRGDLASSGYLSQLETRIFPQMLIRAKLPADFGAYCWNSSAQAITLRRDTLEQPADQPGMWKLTTKQTEDADPEVAYYNAKGELMRIELRRRGSSPNEIVEPMIWEPITLEQLAQLWRSKGLPMD
ncbi:MAG: hypothetical protein KGS45_04630 [Planctomycetes bacterium]|nr:hypothetical protein [Planctomycetota bacterium]